MAAPTRSPRQRREILIRAGLVALRARLIDTPLADRIWAALPIYAAAEIEGQTLQFAVLIEIHPAAHACRAVTAGDVAFSAGRGRMLVAFGAARASAADIWARALDDVAALANVDQGARIAVLEADS